VELVLAKLAIEQKNVIYVKALALNVGGRLSFDFCLLF
jgi:hypothetical protein